MMKRTLTLTLTLCLVLAVVLAAPATPKAAKYVWHINMSTAAADPHNIAARIMSDLVSHRSNGRMKLEIHDNLELASVEDGLEISVPIIDYRQGMPLKHDGTKNDEFVASALGNNRIIFENVRSRSVRLERPSPTEQYWSIITLLTRSFI